MAVRSGSSTPAMYNRQNPHHLDSLTNNSNPNVPWPHTYPGSGPDHYVHPSAVATASRQPKVEPGAQSDSIFNSLYSDSAHLSDPSAFDNWLFQSDPLPQKIDSLVSLCYDDPSSLSASDLQGFEKLRQLLNVDNVKHFLQQSINYHTHWPMIHLPTYDPARSNSRLVLSMIALGSAWSDRMNQSEVRWLMDVTRQAIYRTSPLLGALHNGTLHGEQALLFDLEEVQALVILNSLSIWHGDERQRDIAREEVPTLRTIAQRIGLFSVFPAGHSRYSVLHQRQANNEPAPSDWNWHHWLEQEKRIRTFYLIFLIDAAMVIFFNARACVDIFDLRIPLPSDDAPWEAKHEGECADALGLNGAPAQTKNITGTRRLKQLYFKDALHFLLTAPQYDFAQRSTNAFGKFILIHGLHDHLNNAQRQAMQVPGSQDYGLPSSGPGTPVSQRDWVASDGRSSNANESSGRDTPVNPSNASLSGHPLLESTHKALEKWKKTWDTDLVLQYPPGSDIARVGFCRDAVPYYYLASIFLRVRQEHWNNTPDDHFKTAFVMLKQASKLQDSEGGSVASIDEKYGMDALTQNVSMLFARVSQSEQGLPSIANAPHTQRM